MNYEALADGIKTSFDSRGHILYHVPCALCGEEVIRKAYRGKDNCICPYCKFKEKKKTKEVKHKAILQVKTKEEIRFEKAVKEIEKQAKNIQDYEKAIDIAKTRLEMYGSIPEAMVAIELIRLKYSIIPQQKIKSYRVDFAIPKEKIVIEVDGVVYHHKLTEREAEIQFALGLDWKIIHIPAELIRKDIRKLGKVIQSIKNT